VKKFNIRNVGFEPATIDSLSVGGNHGDDFAITGGDCGTASLDPGITCAVEVAFSPTAGGHRSALLKIVAQDGSYTNVLLDGTGVYQPAVITDVTTVEGGNGITLTGLGYPPLSGVSLSWTDGTGILTQAITDESGAFVVQVPVSMAERPGDRVLAASAFSGETASVAVKVTQAPRQRMMPTSAVFRRRP
jgi:hypothetical protein